MQLTQRQVRLLVNALDEFVDANEDLMGEGASNQERRDHADTRRLMTLMEQELLRTSKLPPPERVRQRTTIEVLSESGDPGPLREEQRIQFHRVELEWRVRDLEQAADLSSRNSEMSAEALLRLTQALEELSKKIAYVDDALQQHVSHTSVKH